MSAPSRLRLRSWELMVYGVVALGAVWPAIRAPGRVIGDGVDLYGTMWFYWWIADCIEQLRDPSYTDLMFHPLGKDIFAHTGNNFVDAALSLPFQELLGFPDYQPWFVLLVLLGNALCFRPLAADLLRSRGAIVAASCLWMASPYLLFELMAGRITQAMVWFFPLAVHHFLRIGGVGPDARLPGLGSQPARWRDPILAGLFTGMQAWTYWFMGWFMALLFGWLALVDLVRRPSGRRARLGGYLLAALVCLLLISPGIVGMAQRVASHAVPGVQFSEEAALLEGPEALDNNVAPSLHGYWLGETQGQPVFAYLVFGGGLALAALLAPDRTRWVGAWLLAIAFALGPVIPLGDGMVMPHYMLAYRYLPFFDRLWFPMRLVVVAMLAATILLGMLLDRVEDWRLRRLPKLPALLLPALVLGLHLWEQHGVLAWPLVNRSLLPPQVYTVIGQVGGGLIELPIGMARPSIAWQPVHQQPTFGGMAENAAIFWPPGFRKRLSNGFIAFLRRVTRDPDRNYSYTPAQLDSLRAEGFRWVVLDRQLVDSEVHRWSFGKRVSPQVADRAPFLVQDNLRAHLGEPVMVEERLVVWDLVGGAAIPAELAPTATSLQERSWAREEVPEYEAWLRARGRMQPGPEGGLGGVGVPTPPPPPPPTEGEGP